MLEKIEKDLQSLSNPQKAKILSRYFKTGKGQYGEGDVFLGLQVPQSREIANKYIEADLQTIKKLLKSSIHEHRLVALLILVERFMKADEKKRKAIIEFYLKNTKYVNNWDLVDFSADKILGEYLIEKDKSLLYKLAKSNNLWEKRISIISTFAFIKRNRLKETFDITKFCLNIKGRPKSDFSLTTLCRPRCTLALQAHHITRILRFGSCRTSLL